MRHGSKKHRTPPTPAPVAPLAPETVAPAPPETWAAAFWRRHPALLWVTVTAAGFAAILAILVSQVPQAILYQGF